MAKNPFSYEPGARALDLVELAAQISPLETAHLPAAMRSQLAGLFLEAAAKSSRTYTVRIDGRLAGICFVEDTPGGREMAFTKTRYLTHERRLTFARSIRQLFADLAKLEAVCGARPGPMYMHVPEGDARSKAWFLRAGCRETERGLECPQ